MRLFILTFLSILVFQNSSLAFENIDTLPLKYQNIPSMVDQPAIALECQDLVEEDSLKNCTATYVLTTFYKNYQVPAILRHSCGGQFFLVIVIIIDKEGNVKDAILLRESGIEELDGFVITTARQLKFIPAKHNGELTDYKFSFPLRFKF